LRVALYDLNQTAVDTVNAASLPHDEPGAAAVLERVVASERLSATTDRTVVAVSRTVIVVVGTPIGQHLNPDVEAVPRVIAAIADQLREGQLLVLRSTVYPGVTAMVEKVVERLGRGIDVAFCPERIAEGKAMTELHELPQGGVPHRGLYRYPAPNAVSHPITRHVRRDRAAPDRCVARAGILERHPHATGREIELHLDRDTMIRVFGWDPEKQGWRVPSDPIHVLLHVTELLERALSESGILGR
jgi:hypothetical protein